MNRQESSGLFRIDKVFMGGSLALLVMINLFNGLNFAFQVFMARLLSIAEYGILTTLISFYYIFGIFSESLQTIITRYVSAEKDGGKVKNIMKRSLRRSLHLSLLIFFLYAALSFPMSKVLNIPYGLLVFNGLMIFAALFLPVSRGLMMGGRRFRAVGANMVFEGFFKLVLAVGFVVAGWGVMGAVGGAIAASVLAFGISLKVLSGIAAYGEKRAEIPSVYAYSPHVFLAILALMLFYSLDILIARMVFDAVSTGRYAFASVLAKSIFLVTHPISRAMFPLSSRNQSAEKDPRPLFWNAFVMLMALIIPALLLFGFLSEELIRLFTGDTIPESASLLPILGAAAGFLSLANLKIFYKLSLGCTGRSSGLFIFVAVEIGLLLLFSQNLFSFSLAFLAASALLFLGSHVFPGRHETCSHHSRS